MRGCYAQHAVAVGKISVCNKMRCSVSWKAHA